MSQLILTPLNARTMLVPHSRDELIRMIARECAMHGNQCDLNHIDVSGITDFSAIFQASTFNGDISKWNTSSAQLMVRMFQDSSFTGDISNWDVSKVTDMGAMFHGAKFNGDISRWNTSELVNAIEMFAHSQFDNDLSLWDVSKVEEMGAIFKDSVFTGKRGGIGKWNVSRVRNMNMLFQSSPFDSDISEWDVGSVVHADRMFAITHFNRDLSKWKFDALKSACSMFRQSTFDGDLSAWRLHSVIMLQGMFAYAAFAGDLSSWRLNKGANATGMFSPDFEGVLPTQLDQRAYQSYASMLKGEANLHYYLERTPFGPAHFETLLELDEGNTPTWSTPQDHAWAKAHSETGRMLELDADAIRDSAAQGYALQQMEPFLCTEFTHPSLQGQ